MRVDDLVKRTGALTLALAVAGACGTASALARHHSSSHQSRHHGRQAHQSKAAAKPRYAYPVDMFMMEAPSQDLSLLPSDQALKIRYAFQSGTASNFAPEVLVRSGAVSFYALHGGIFSRREKVKYIVVHSTETGVPQDARHVINAWSSGGRRHPGAQYIVDRDGTIFETVDPQYATVHVNIFKTVPGINNDDSVGIEMCHSSGQTYTAEQRASVIRLVTYLQDRYHVLDENVVTHRYAQQGDHTDPVDFDWDGFLSFKDAFHSKALAMVHEPGLVDSTAPEEQPVSLDLDAPVASVYLEMHTALKQTPSYQAHVSSIQELERQLQDAQQAQRDIAAMQNASQSSATGEPSTNNAHMAPTAGHANPVDLNAPMAPRITQGKTGLPIRPEIELSPSATTFGGK
jgi:hypothetical protein